VSRWEKKPADGALILPFSAPLSFQFSLSSQKRKAALFARLFKTSLGRPYFVVGMYR
jgi:hypothetical protein